MLMKQLVTYLREVQVELKKVTWPTRRETLQMTWVVLGVSLAVGLYVGGLDLGFTNILASYLK